MLHANDEGLRIGRFPASDIIERAALQTNPVIAIKGSGDIGGCQRLAVVEGDPLAELESIAHAIRGFLHGFGQFRDGLVVLIARDQRFIDIHRDIAR